MTTTHTPLPWYSIGPEGLGYLAIVKTLVPETPQSVIARIAFQSDVGLTEEDIANAAFIVDAVNSITPLREQNTAMSMALEIIARTTDSPELHKIARAALKHARS